MGRMAEELQEQQEEFTEADILWDFGTLMGMKY